METEVSDLYKVAGQDMLEETAEELHGRERSDAGLAVFTPAITKADGLGIGRKDVPM